MFWESDEGARRSGLGRGREVRCGFWARAVVMAGADDGGVMSFMSFESCQSWDCGVCEHEVKRLAMLWS